MQTLTRQLLLGLAPFAFGALVGTGVVAAGLERSAQQLRVQEALKADALFLASLGSDPATASCLRSALTAFLSVRPQLVSARVEGADGSALASAGDERAARARIDRTFFLKGAPVRVLLGYREETGGFRVGIRVGVWLVFSALFTAAVFVALALLVRRTVVRPLEALRLWSQGAAPRPEPTATELVRLADALQERGGAH